MAWRNRINSKFLDDLAEALSRPEEERVDAVAELIEGLFPHFLDDWYGPLDEFVDEDDFGLPDELI